MNDYISISEAAKILKVSRPTVYKFIGDGTLPAERRPGLRGAIRIKRADAEKLADALGYKPVVEPKP